MRPLIVVDLQRRRPSSCLVAGVSEPNVEVVGGDDIIWEDRVDVSTYARRSGIVHSQGGEDLVGVGREPAVEDSVGIPDGESCLCGGRRVGDPDLVEILDL